MATIGSHQVQEQEQREQWRALPYHVGASDLHFRQSDALVRLAEQPSLWWHSTERPTLILGATQTQFDFQRCEAAGVLAVKRQAGGTAVFAEAGVVGLDVMLPTGHRLIHSDVLETYHWLGEIWTTALCHLGIAAHLVSVAKARAATAPLPRDAPIRMACFGTLSPYEVTVEGRKLVGLAQVRRRHGVLLQSAIHRHFDAARLGALVGIEGATGVASLRQAAIGLDEIADVSIERVMSSFEETLEGELAVRLVPGHWTQAEIAHVNASGAT